LVFKEVGTETGFKFYANRVDKDEGFFGNIFCFRNLEKEDQTMIAWITLSGDRVGSLESRV